MTMATNALNSHEPEIIGPYSEWPRRPRNIWKKLTAFAGTLIVAGVYLHCGVPLVL